MSARDPSRWPSEADVAAAATATAETDRLTANDLDKRERQALLHFATRGMRFAYPPRGVGTQTFARLHRRGLIEPHHGTRARLTGRGESVAKLLRDGEAGE